MGTDMVKHGKWSMAILAFVSSYCWVGYAQDLAPTPADYPTTSVEDHFTATPFDVSYEARRQAFLDLTVANPGHGPFSEAARIAMGRLPDEHRIQDALDNMEARKDCADFGLHGILRLLYQFGDSPLLSDGFRARARKSILDFKYWPDEPGIDSMCTWSENHYIMFSAAGYLAGQLFPDETFTNSGQTGREKMEICRPRILRWLDLRYRSGFSEWLSNVYYEEDLTPLLNLVDFCQDEEIAKRATMVVDLLVADMALNSFHGIFGSTHGRTYEHHKKWSATENTGPAFKLLFGMNTFRAGNMTAVSFALSPKYRMPQVLYEIATDFNRPEILNKQRMGIRLKDAKRWGLDFNRLEDGMLFCSLEAYSDPRTINLFVRMLDKYNWWENEFFVRVKERRKLVEIGARLHVLPLVAWLFRRDVQRNHREEANICTYRTPDYMLSSAQDYRRGYGGDQQHVWQATLGQDAVCFTTHPALCDERSPGYWVGSGDLPRVAQVKNVAIIIYRISTGPALYVPNKFMYTHAWFPKDKFDEVIERNGWICARRGDGYLALWSQQPYHWQTEEGEDKDREVIAPGKRNIWICELGRRATDGEFTEFVARIAEAPVSTDRSSVFYQSPSQGRLKFGWNGDLTVNGQPIQLDDYPRYDNPYAQAPFPGDAIAFEHNGQSLRLNWQTLEREASAFLK